MFHLVINSTVGIGPWVLEGDLMIPEDNLSQCYDQQTRQQKQCFILFLKISFLRLNQKPSAGLFHFKETPIMKNVLHTLEKLQLLGISSITLVFFNRIRIFLSFIYLSYTYNKYKYLK